MAIQEKIYIGDEKFLREQEHFCPECAAKLSVCKLSWMVLPKENTSLREYHPDGFRYVLYKLKCKSCDKLYSQPEIKKLEKAAADEQRAQTEKMCKKTAKKVAKKISNDVEKDIYKQMKIKYGLEKPKRKPLSEAFSKIKNAFCGNNADGEKRDININFSFHKM